MCTYVDQPHQLSIIWLFSYIHSDPHRLKWFVSHPSRSLSLSSIHCHCLTLCMSMGEEMKDESMKRSFKGKHLYEDDDPLMNATTIIDPSSALWEQKRMV